MENQNISFLAPSLFQQHWSITEVLGSIIWIWMHSPHHQQYTIQTFRQHVIPAVNCHQFAIFYPDQQPIAYFTWAMFKENDLMVQHIIKNNINPTITILVRPTKPQEGVHYHETPH